MLLPHPDDEFQVWSQVEHRSDAYTVFIVMTRGEESVHCDSATGGGRWTDSCQEARLDAWVSFVEQMGKSDPSLPSMWPQEPDQVTGLVSSDVVLSRDDDGRSVAPADPLVWLDEQDRGALVAFDLGDGDLTAQEVRWAAQQVVQDPTLFGLHDQQPDRVLGAYYYDGHAPGCFEYPRKDHGAVADVITSADLAPEQLYATCANDADIGPVVESKVSQRAVEAAFGDSGAFPANFGWLGGWSLARADQSELFHVPQAFWSRSGSRPGGSGH